MLGHSDYRNFQSVIESARTACFNSGQRLDDPFGEVTDMVEIGSGARRPLKTVMMSRYACYLVIQNADPVIGEGILAQGVGDSRDKTLSEGFADGVEIGFESEDRLFCYQRNEGLEILIHMGAVEGFVISKATLHRKDDGRETGFEQFQIHQQAGCAAVAIHEGMDFHKIRMDAGGSLDRMQGGGFCLAPRRESLH